MSADLASVGDRREARALGSPLRLLVSPEAATEAVDRAWSEIRAEFDAVDTAMSRFREDSELTRLHRQRGPVAGVTRRLAAALTAADRACRLTADRFDARVVTDLERLGSAGVHLSWGVEPRDHGRLMRRSSGAGTVELLVPVDLGGIGKGLALRWARRRAAAVLGAAGFLLEAGGDIASQGSFAGVPWSIGIEDPSGSDQHVAVCVLDPDQAIATSSVRLGRWQGPGVRPVHHLIDPSTGEPGGTGLVSVTVTNPDPAWAEVWSKALFLEGAAGIGDVARRRGLAAWWIAEGGELSMTPSARQQTSWVRAEARRQGTPSLMSR
jgi:thiamine biosynthesis lipoprotein